MLPYNYDAASRPITLDANPTTNDYRYADLSAAGAYTPQGDIASANLAASNLAEARHYNARLQPVSIADSWGGTQQWLIRNTYSATQNNGDVTGQSEKRFNTTSWSQTYAYDTLNRLSTASEASGWTQTYVYDRFGNRAVFQGSYTPGGSEATMTPEVSSNTESAVLSAFPNNKWIGAPTDNAGEQLSIAGVLTGIQYDAEGHMVQATNGSGLTSNYVYDGEGRRVQRTSGATTVQYVYDTNGELAAEYSNTPDTSGGTKFPVEDHLGSIRAVRARDRPPSKSEGYERKDIAARVFVTWIGT